MATTTKAKTAVAKSKTTTKSKTATAKTTKTATPPVVETPVEVTASEASAPSMDAIANMEVAKAPRKFNADDMVTCRSVRNGVMQYVGRKTGDLYEWTDYGDVTDVAYSDLLAIKVNKSKFIYGPWFLIEDPEAVEALKLTELYEQFADYTDVESFLELPAAEMRRKLQNAPDGFKDTVARTAGLKIRDGRFDSVIKIKVIDDVLGKNLMSMINSEV